MKAGDIIKAKYNGRKQKFQILGVHDTIKENYLHLSMSCFGPMDYDDTIKKFSEQFNTTTSLNKLGFEKTYCDGDTVSNGHTHRVYLKPIPW